jgi:hypothetical protein
MATTGTPLDESLIIAEYLSIGSDYDDNTAAHRAYTPHTLDEDENNPDSKPQFSLGVTVTQRAAKSARKSKVMSRFRVTNTRTPNQASSDSNQPNALERIPSITSTSTITTATSINTLKTPIPAHFQLSSSLANYSKLADRDVRYFDDEHSNLSSSSMSTHATTTSTNQAVSVANYYNELDVDQIGDPLSPFSSLPDVLLSHFFFSGFLPTTSILKVFSLVSKRLRDIARTCVLSLDLHSLPVTGVNMTTVAVRYQHLTQLDLSFCEFADDAAAMALLPLKRTLTTLILKGTNVTDRGLIDGVSHLKSLRVLELGKTKIGQILEITDAGVIKLAEELTDLRGLGISWCKSVTDASIAKVATMKKLVALDVSLCTQLSNASCGHLARMSLKELNVGGCKGITKIGIAALLMCDDVSLMSSAISSSGGARERTSDAEEAKAGEAADFIVSNHLALYEHPSSYGTGAAKLLKRRCSLERLYIPHSNATAGTLYAIAKLAVSLRLLDLSDCDSITMGSEDAAEALRMLQERGCAVRWTVDDIVRLPLPEWARGH